MLIKLACEVCFNLRENKCIYVCVDFGSKISIECCTHVGLLN